MIKKIIYTILGILVIPVLSFAAQITVPSAPGAGYGLISTSTGAYVASSTFWLVSGNNAWLIGNGLIFNATTSDKVGIGSTSPIATLSVQGTTSSPTRDLFDVASSTGANVFSILSNGNVGIGTSAPTSPFSVANNFTVTSAGAATAATFLTANSGGYNIMMGGYPGAESAYSGIWMGVTPSGTNYTFLSTAGQTLFNVSGGGSMTYAVNNVNQLWLTTGLLNAGSGIVYGWSSNSVANGTPDTGFSRLSTNKVGLGNGSAGDVSGTFIANTIGISTTSPFVPLTVVGQAYISASTTIANLNASNCDVFSTTAGSLYCGSNQSPLSMGTGIFNNGNTLNTPWTLVGNNLTATNTAYNVGIGTDTPVVQFQVGGADTMANGPAAGLGNAILSCSTCNASSSNILSIAAYASNAIGVTSGINSFAARGNYSTPSAVKNGDVLYFMGGRGYGTTAWAIGSKAAIREITSQDWTDSNQGTAMTFEVTPNNSTTRSTKMKLTESGDLILNSATTPANQLEVGGSVEIGTTNLGVTAPTNGAIIGGAVSIGKASNAAQLDVSATAGTSPLALSSSTGSALFSIDGAGNILTGGGTPTLSSCGTSPSIVGNDTSGQITFGGGALLTSCTVTFSVAKTANANNKVHVFVNQDSGSLGIFAAQSVTTTGFNITTALSGATGDTVSYFVVQN